MLPRGTTPTIEYTFSTVNPADIIVCYFTLVKETGKKIELLVERDISTATIGEHSISWRLTQEETLKIPNNQTDVIAHQIRYRLNDGTAGESVVSRDYGSRILKDGVI